MKVSDVVYEITVDDAPLQEALERLSTHLISADELERLIENLPDLYIIAPGPKPLSFVLKPSAKLEALLA